MRIAWRPLSLGFAALALFLNCEDRVAGNGSEVENAVVVGMIDPASGSGGNGKPTGTLSLALYPSDYNAMEDAPLPASSFITVKPGGPFRLKTKPGTYNLYGVESMQGDRVFVQNIVVGEKTTQNSGIDSLRIPGSLRVTLPQGSWEGGYLYIPGTPLAVSVDSAADSSGTLRMDSVPACRIKALFLARKGKPNSSQEIAHDIVVQQGRVTQLPYTEWNYSASIRINTAAVPAPLTGTVTNIPLLLRLKTGDIDFSQARGDGGDLRFTKENGVALPCHVQDWDSAGGHADVWIKLDSVYADTLPRRILMHWGNTKATVDWPAAPAGGAAVFDTSDGYAGAWHFDTAPSDSLAGFADQSPQNNHAQPRGQLAAPDSLGNISAANGTTGSGIFLNGKNAFLTTSSDLPGPAVFTISMWFRTTSKEGGKIVGFVMPTVNGSLPGKVGNFNFDRVVWMDNDGLLHAGFTMRSADYPASFGYWQSFTAATPYNDGQWHQVAYSMSDTGAVLFVDGVKVGGYSGLVRPLPVNGHWQIGYSGEGMWDPVWTSEFFQASVDEVRVIHHTRSENWLRLDYASQRNGSSLFVIEKP